MKRGFDCGGVWKFSTLALAAAVLGAGCASTGEPERSSSDAAADALVSSTVPPPAAAAERLSPATATSTVALQPQAPLTYVVKKGDTLWGIASRFILDPWQWPEIWYVNDQVRNPHLIYPGDVLKLMVVDGRMRVGLDVERMSPQIRESSLEGAIPTIPIEAIRDFLRGPRLVTPEELKTAPYLLAFVDEHIIGGEGNLIYVKQLPESEPYNYALVRPGKPYRDPDDGSILGYEALPVGQVEVKEYGNPAVANLSETYREALVGDRLLPVELDAFRNDFYPRAPERPVGARIIAAFDGVSQISQYQIVALNRGSEHGLEPGHVLQILQTGDKVRDPYGHKRVQLPDQPAGSLLVFKVTPKLSFGLVMSLTRPAHVLDKAEKPKPTTR